MNFFFFCIQERKKEKKDLKKERKQGNRLKILKCEYTVVD